MTGPVGRSLESVGVLLIDMTTPWPAVTLPKTLYLPLRKVLSAALIKNWLPWVFGPECAIDTTPAALLAFAFSSANW